MPYVVLSIALVSVVVALVFVVTASSGRRRLPPAPPTAPPVNPAPKETPREILDRRFAAGEIDIDEYAEKRAAIEESKLPRKPPRSGGAEPGSN